MDLAPLLIAFSRLKAYYPDRPPKLIIAGDEQYPGYAKILSALGDELGLAENLEIWTDIADEILPDIYKLSDVFISLSDNVQETFGLTIIEAMSSGLPVIASSWNGCRELVIPGETGFLIPTYAAPFTTLRSERAVNKTYRKNLHHIAGRVSVDLTACVDAMLALAGRGSRWLQYSMKSRSVAVQEYGWKAIISKHQEIWEEAIVAGDVSSPKMQNFLSVYGYDYGHVFGHYADAPLTFSNGFLKTKDTCFSTSTLKTLAELRELDWGMCKIVLDTIAEKPGFSDPDNISDIRGYREEIEDAVMFLLKLGVIEYQKGKKAERN